ncbi:PREDICTED: nuclear pore complex protein Nup214 isoform X2 [Rhagoletis zephyria]|uniref:nuclear pore complex protein Nup214 isoform X2 n=1 Tax=Rhagoletis zephyria TaxID=28612 RepID=UPI000811918D|nr:PREDICTED: nuclear pore complex protein Nup214 isoform X2 [Rhagoletis zephyria]
MAQQCPASVDVTDIQFKLQCKHKVFAENSKLRDHVNLLACASNHGLLFVGNPNAPELHAFILPDVIYAKSKGLPVHLRTTKLPNAPNTLACSADGSMLAVNYTLQGYAVLDIFHVPSFSASDIKTLYSIRLPDQNVYALHLLWNPVLPSVVGVVLSNGNFALYTLKDGGAIEMRSITNQQIQCGCWSPKGKQIVLGHPNGKLQQFKPDLTPVKSIVCPPGVHPGPFDTIALHWLSTFQFVVSFLQQGQEAMPNMYIVNAPKGGTPVYINYNDVCYSGSEPRRQQVNFLHIAQWNLLLVTSANGVEIGLLGTKENTEQPQWVHYMLLDEARIEMPLTEASDETYPIGLTLDTSPNHQLTVGEQKLQTMPVIHVLTTHGHLLCFNFLNLTANATNICSPPAPINYAMEKFSTLDESLTRVNVSKKVENERQDLELPSIDPPPPTPTQAFSVSTQSNFSNQNTFAFGAPGNQNLFSGGWDQKSQGVKFGVATTNNESQSNLLNKPLVQTAPIANNAQIKTTQPAEIFKPLYTVSPEFAPPPIQAQQQSQQNSVQIDTAGKSKAQMLNLNETNSVIQQMIVMQMMAFEKEITQLGQKSKLALNEDPSVMRSYSKRLINLQEIIEQANERDFVMDVQDLRHSLTESYEMLNECRTKLEMHKNPDEAGFKYLSLYDCVSQRQLKSLQGYLAINQGIMKRLEEQMDIQWTYYQDLVRRNSKSQMRIPCLDGIYQQMTKLKNLITQQQTKLHYIKSTIKQKNLGSGRVSKSTLNTLEMKSDAGIASLADSILSMSMHNITDVKTNKLSESKLNALRNFTNQQVKTTIIKPQRPNRVQLTSEVILETKQLIKRKESKEKEAKVIKAIEKANEAQEKEKAVTTFKSTQPKQPHEPQFQLTKTPSTIGLFGNSQTSAATFTQAKDANSTQSVQKNNAPFSTLNFTSSNMFSKTESAKGEKMPELSKFIGNVNTFKSDAVESKTNESSMSEKSSPAGPNFSFISKSDAADANKPPMSTFNIKSKGFTGFGQESTANTNANTTFINPSKTVDSNTANQMNSTSKSFSFGNTFSALTDLKIGATQTQSNVPPATSLPAATANIFGTTTVQSTLFNKQNENQSFASSVHPFSGATSTPSLGKTEAMPTKSTAEAAVPAKDVTKSGQVATASDNEEMILKPLNICKPTAKAVKPKEGTVFSFSSNSENNPQGAFQPMPDSTTSLSVPKVTDTTSSTTVTSTPSIFGKSVATTETSLFPPFNANSSNVSTFGVGGVTGISFGTAPNVSAPVTSSISGTGASAFSFSNSTVFKQLHTFEKPTTTSTPTSSAGLSTTPAITNAPTVPATTTIVTAFTTTTAAATVPSVATTSSPIPATTSSAAATTIATPTPVSSAATGAATGAFFSAIAATKATGDSLFGSLGQPTPAASSVSAASKIENVTQPAGNASAFGGLPLGGQAPASGGSIFGNAGSGFGATTAGIFGATAAATMPTNPSNANTSSGSIFGNSAVNSGDNTSASIFGNSPAKPAEASAGSIFGNAAAKSAENTGGSIFGSGAAKSPENVNVFGSPTSVGTAASSGSIFGQNSLGQSSGSIFAAAASKPESTSTASGFSFVGSAFGSAAKSTASTGGSIFGGAAAVAPDSQQSNIFGSPTSGFGAVATSPFSSFSQGGSSVSSTGFGSPTQQPQGGAFPRNVFGVAPSFGSPPAFGAQPSFGGAPTFGSPKGFGTFATPPSSSFGAPTAQSSNIFEALGSTDTGLSFGNLAQTTNPPPNAPKPMFGGSSFMNYRA